MRQRDSVLGNLDWIAVGLFGALVLFGWLNIWAAISPPDVITDPFSGDNKAGIQFRWVLAALGLVVIVLFLESRVFEQGAYIFYGITTAMLIGVLLFGVEVNGARSWFQIGSARFQPSEFAKLGTVLAVAHFLSRVNVRFGLNLQTLLVVGLIAAPPILIVAQPDAGSALVFAAFIVVLYVRGLPAYLPLFAILGVLLFLLSLTVSHLVLFILIGVVGLVVFLLMRKRRKNIFQLVGVMGAVSGVIVGTDYFVNKVLQPHQQLRIQALIDPWSDPRGFGWNIIQSKIAIGSGGFAGKGFREGTITKYDFVPEQHTDFIFCTIGEEHGWLGTTVVLGLFVGLMFRLGVLAERQKTEFARLVGYGVVGILLLHVTINVGMTVGLFPVIGIPLPFFSYGGSSLVAFTLLLFVFLRLDASRASELERRR